MLAEVNRRTLDSIPFFVDNEAETPVLIKESQPVAARVPIVSSFAENRDPSLAHPNRNEGRLDVKSASDNGRIESEGAVFKIYYRLSLSPPCSLAAFSGWRVGVFFIP